MAAADDVPFCFMLEQQKILWPKIILLIAHDTHDSRINVVYYKLVMQLARLGVLQFIDSNNIRCAGKGCNTIPRPYARSAAFRQPRARLQAVCVAGCAQRHQKRLRVGPRCAAEPDAVDVLARRWTCSRCLIPGCTGCLRDTPVVHRLPRLLLHRLACSIPGCTGCLACAEVVTSKRTRGMAKAKAAPPLAEPVPKFQSVEQLRDAYMKEAHTLLAAVDHAFETVKNGDLTPDEATKLLKDTIETMTSRLTLGPEVYLKLKTLLTERRTASLGTTFTSLVTSMLATVQVGHDAADHAGADADDNHNDTKDEGTAPREAGDAANAPYPYGFAGGCCLLCGDKSGTCASGKCVNRKGDEADDPNEREE